MLQRRILSTVCAGFLAFGAASPSVGQDFLYGQPRVSVHFQLGYAVPSASGEIFDFTRETLTLEDSDFHAFSWRAGLGVRLAPDLDLRFGAGLQSSESPSEYRLYEGSDGLPIEQVTMFRRTPVTVGLRLYPTSRGRRISQVAWIPSRGAPSVGGGLGWMFYEFEQWGEFVDTLTDEIFQDYFDSKGSSYLFYAVAGLEVAVGRRWTLFAEARYTSASAELRGDFIGFEDIDLGGLSAGAGLAIRL